MGLNFQTFFVNETYFLNFLYKHNRTVQNKLSFCFSPLTDILNTINVVHQDSLKACPSYTHACSIYDFGSGGLNS